MKHIQVLRSNELFSLWDPTAIQQQGQIILSYCISGTTKVAINTTNYFVSPGTLLTLLPQSLVLNQQPSVDFQCVHLVFSFRAIDEMILPTNYNFLSVLVEQPLVVLEQEDRSLFEQYIALFQQQESTDSIFQVDALRYLLYSFIAHINRVYQQEEGAMQPSSRKDVAVFQFYNLLHQYYLVEKSVNFYADQLKLSPKYLTTLIRQRTGKSISKVIRELVLIKAKTYLTATDFPIYQIAEQLHFADATTFCRYFKTYVGHSPMKYRQIHR
ncbi:AraC family transcriptional regulator [Myroides fluvii]|uniref:AraC family transcriptional regulator n=1 Tax=Myroides fluvii TaxID=2572594 RepID=UPI00131B9ED0|nr:helix-turn-helix domain-containing protein [Myroides fluvii]